LINPVEVEMIRVGKNRYMSLKDAIAKGYNPRLNPPVKGEPIFAPEGIVNFCIIVFSLWLGYHLTGFLRYFFFGH
jgi:hypothetical protein